MDCPICSELEQRYRAGLSEYSEARSSAYHRVTERLAAKKNVDMERARLELEEHRLVCVFAVSVMALVPQKAVPPRLRRYAA